MVLHFTSIRNNLPSGLFTYEYTSTRFHRVCTLDYGSALRFRYQLRCLPLPEEKEQAAMTSSKPRASASQHLQNANKTHNPCPPTQGTSKLKPRTVLVTTPIQVKRNRHWLATFFLPSDRLRP